MIKRLFPTFIVLTSFLLLNAAELRFEKQYTDDLKSVAFYPLGTNGFFLPGETVRSALVIGNNTDTEITSAIELAVKSYDGKIIEKQDIRKKLPPKTVERIEIDFPGPENKGYFTVSASVKANGRKALETQTGFIVISPVKRRDPFFGIDKNLITPKLLKGYELLGAGSLGIGINWYQPSWCRDLSYIDKALNGFLAPILQSDFKIIGYLSPQVPYGEAAKTRLKKGLPVLTDADIEHVSKFSERLARLTKDRIRLWIIQQEFDADFRNQKMSGGGAATLANYVTMTRTIYQAVKRANPDTNIAVLGINGSDYFHGKPPFVLSRIVLDDLKENFDLLAIDAYSGNWNALRGPIDPPEKGLKRFLTDAAELSRSYQRPGIVLNAERCYAMDYSSAFDSDTARTIADYTARSVIINRASPSPLYILHVGAFYSLPHQIRKGVYNATTPLVDYGAAWKVIFDEKGEETFIPRPSAMAFATVARELAFVSEPQEILIGNDIYSYLFSRENGEQVIAIWSMEEPSPLHLELPVVATLTDMMGNRRKLKAGNIVLNLTGSPQFLTLACKKTEAASLLAHAKIPNLVLFKSIGRLTSRDTMLLQIRNLSSVHQSCRLNQANGQSQELTLPPRQITEISMEPTAAELIAADGKHYPIPTDFSYLTATELKANPVLDGTGKWFTALKPVKLQSPDHIYPKSALVPELNLLQFDGKDISADLYFAWTPQYFYLAAKVHDRKHLQRRHNANIWMDDVFQFVISTRNNAVPKALRSPSQKTSFSAAEYNFGLALTDQGPELYSWGGGRAPAGNRPYPISVKRTGTTTLYEAAIPWNAIGVVPKAGLGIRLGAILMDNNRPEDRQAKYWLALAQGVAGTQDASEFKTIILE